MRQRFRAVPAVRAPASVTIGVSMTRASGAASVVALPTTADISVYDRIKGPFIQRNSRSYGETTITDEFFVYVYGVLELLETDTFEWRAPVYPDGTIYTIPGTEVEILTPNVNSTMITLTYQSDVSAGYIDIGCMINGSYFIITNAMYGSDMGCLYEY